MQFAMPVMVAAPLNSGAAAIALRRRTLSCGESLL